VTGPQCAGAADRQGEPGARAGGVPAGDLAAPDGAATEAIAAIESAAAAPLSRPYGEASLPVFPQAGGLTVTARGVPAIGLEL